MDYNKICEELVRKYNIQVEHLTETQLATAIKQAIESGDFQRLICKGAQTVIYLPYEGMEYYRSRYLDLRGDLTHEEAKQKIQTGK